QDEQQRAPLDMAQEAVPQAPVLARPLDQPRDVGEQQARVAAKDVRELDDPDVRRERCEGVRGRPGPGLCDRLGERGLARVREADEADVRNRLEDQPEYPGLAGLAGIGPPGRAVCRGLEMGVAPAAVA